MTGPSDAAFEMPAQIGTRVKWLDANGSVAVRDGRLALRKQDGSTIVESPINEVSASKYKLSMGSALKIRVNGKNFVVDPLGFQSSAAVTDIGKVVDGVRALSSLKRGRKLSEQMLMALEELGCQG